MTITRNKEKQSMVNRFLTPKSLVIEGPISYSESIRCRNIIRLKKEIVKLYGDADWHRIICFYNKDEFLSMVKNIEKNEEPIPILLYLGKK